MSELMWVDDNVSMTDAMVVLFELAGHKVTRADSATEALECLQQRGLDSFAAIIIDVMLTPGADTETFSPELTRECVITGLVLTDAIVRKFGNGATRKLFLYTRASQGWVVKAVRDCASRLNIKWAPRGAQMTPDRFYAEIESIMH